MGYERFPELFRQIFEMKTTDQAVEEDITMQGLGLAIQSSEGEASPFDYMRQLYITRYIPTDYRLGIIITKNMISDGRAVNILAQRAKSMGIAVNETLNTLAANVLNRAQTTGFNGGDGVTLINPAHPVATGATYSNTPSVAADLSEGALEQAYIDLGNFVDERGLKIKAYPRQLIIPRALTFEAQRILGSELRVGTSDNDLNAIKNLQIFPEGILVNDYITSPTTWFIKTSANENGYGLKGYMRQDTEMSEDVHFDTDNVKFKMHFRVVFGWSDARCLYGSIGP